MVVRVQTVGPYQYLQVVANRREGRRPVQRVVGTLGRRDQLQATGATDALLRSLARFGQRVRVLDAYAAGQLEARAVRQMGPDLVFGRLWQSPGVQALLYRLLADRQFEFPVERAVYLSVLHRLCASGSDRAAARWQRDQRLPGAEPLQLHPLYRAMRWLGEQQATSEEALVALRRDLFTDLTLAFFDTTSLYFEGRGGESLGQHGHSKDHRPDRHQLVLGAVLTGEGRPIGSAVWPGNHADGRALLPVVDRLRERFGLQRVCWVADRGMISAATSDALEVRRLEYILGARLRSQREIREEVLARAGRYREVAENRRVKAVWVDDRRYIVCHNPPEAVKDAADRAAIVQALTDRLREGAKQLVGNRGFRRFVRVERGAVTLDRQRVAADARYDGKFVLRTNTTLPAAEVAVQYKRLLLVEQFFRAAKTLLETRPIVHQWDATSRGHVFCSFLALVLVDELQRRLAAHGWQFEWEVSRQDLAALAEVAVYDGEQAYLLRTTLVGVTGKLLQAAGVAIPPPVRRLPAVVPHP